MSREKCGGRAMLGHRIFSRRARPARGRSDQRPVVSHAARHPPSSVYSRERAGERVFGFAGTGDESFPLSPALSPEYREEGVRCGSRLASPAALRPPEKICNRGDAESGEKELVDALLRELRVSAVISAF